MKLFVQITGRQEIKVSIKCGNRDRPNYEPGCVYRCGASVCVCVCVCVGG